MEGDLRVADQDLEDQSLRTGKISKLQSKVKKSISSIKRSGRKVLEKLSTVTHKRAKVNTRRWGISPEDAARYQAINLHAIERRLLLAEHVQSLRNDKVQELRLMRSAQQETEQPDFEWDTAGHRLTLIGREDEPSEFDQLVAFAENSYRPVDQALFIAPQ